jgi:hypothetical protein
MKNQKNSNKLEKAQKVFVGVCTGLLPPATSSLNNFCKDYWWHPEKTCHQSVENIQLGLLALEVRFDRSPPEDLVNFPKSEFEASENFKKIRESPENVCECLYMSLTTCHKLIDPISTKEFGDTLKRLVTKM